MLEEEAAEDREGREQAVSLVSSGRAERAWCAAGCLPALELQYHAIVGMPEPATRIP